MKIAAWGVATFYSIWQNAYFGWHALPHSDAELIVDGINLLMFAIAFQMSQPTPHKGAT